MAPRPPKLAPPEITPVFSLYAGADLVRGRFLFRRDRFTVRCVPEGGAETWAHLPNPGRLWEHLRPGVGLRLLPVPGRSLPWRVVGVDHPEGTVMLDTVRANGAVRWLLEHHLVPGFENARVVRAETVHGDSRFDFELEEDGKPLLLEVKSCTLFAGGVAMFPDAPTERGRRHLEELAHLTARGTACGVLFFIQSTAVRGFLPDFHTDPDFAETLGRVAPLLRIRAVGVDWTPELTLRLPVRAVPLMREVLLRENRDQGTLLLALSPVVPTLFDPGHAPLLLEPGHYLYGEDVASGLFRATRRRWGNFSLRLRGAPDPTRSTATPLPIRSSEPLAAGVLRELGALGELVWRRSAPEGFLVRLSGAPLASSAVMDLLLSRRMGRLAPPEDGGGGGNNV